jgi:V/A-type H+/Na+-transporting ATPase subunit I
MIAPMKKFLLVLLEKDLANAPLQLRKLGIAHPEKFEVGSAACDGEETALNQAQLAKSILGSRPAAKNKPKETRGAKASVLISATLRLSEEISALQDSVAELQREIDRIREWGDFDSTEIAKLSTAGFDVKLYECLANQLNSIPQECDFIKIAAPKGKARFAIFGDTSLPQDFIEFRLPARRLSEILSELSREEADIAEKGKLLDSYAAERKLIDREISRVESSLTIERLRAGMPKMENLRYLSGYVPAREAAKLQSEASKRGWAIAIGDPSDDEMPPTKIENSPVVRIIQPIFDFLGTIPHYREYDISLWFLIFFSVFFAMIFGDGGYGLLLFAGGAALAIKPLKAKKPIPDAMKLLMVLGFATVLWGFATATWFAIPFDQLPKVLQNLSLTAINSSNPDADTNVRIFCFILGALQLSVAHIKNVKRDFPNLKFLAQLGSLLLVWGMFNIALNLVIDSVRFPLQNWILYLIGGGFGLIFVFSNWNGNLLTSILETTKGIIPTLLGMVSVFADIVSYIRLWAVGLTGLAISQTVNGMALGILGTPGHAILLFIIRALLCCTLLLVGHSMNFVMSILSVVVHGIRLNILEFSGHLGMEWSGYKYEPLSEPAEEGSEQESKL